VANKSYSVFVSYQLNSSVNEFIFVDFSHIMFSLDTNWIVRSTNLYVSVGHGRVIVLYLVSRWTVASRIYRMPVYRVLMAFSLGINVYSTANHLQSWKVRNFNIYIVVYEMFDVTKGLIRRRKLKKDIQCNGQTKKGKRTNNDLPNTSQKTKHGSKRTSLKTWGKLGWSGMDRFSEMKNKIQKQNRNILKIQSKSIPRKHIYKTA
jgi:hypothetical protein